MHVVNSVGDLLDVEVAREVGDILCRKPYCFIYPSPEHDANLPPPPQQQEAENWSMGGMWCMSIFHSYYGVTSLQINRRC